MTEQALDLLLKSTIDLVEELETKKLIADENLVAVVQHDFRNRAAIHERAVGRMEIRDPENCSARRRIDVSADTRMQARRFGVVQTNVRVERAAECDFRPFERDRRGEQFTAEGHEHGPPFRGRRLADCGSQVQPEWANRSRDSRVSFRFGEVFIWPRGVRILSLLLL